MEHMEVILIPYNTEGVEKREKTFISHLTFY